MPLQEWIHKFEEGEGTRYIKSALLILLFAGLAAWYDVRNFKAFSGVEAMDSAQVAREIAHGNGFSTKFIRPLSVRLLQAHQTEASKPLTGPHPDLANAPVFPVIQAGLIKVLPMNFAIPDGVAFLRYGPEVWFAIFNQLLFLLMLWALYKLSFRLFDKTVAMATVTVTAFTELFWKYSVSGLPTILLTLVTIGIVWCMTSMETRTREQTATDGFFYGMSACLAALLAIGSLTRYSYGFLIIPIIIYAAAFFGTRRAIAISMVVVVFLLAVGGWGARNWQLCGKPFGIAGYSALQGTFYYPHNRLERTMPKSIDMELGKVSIDQFRRKMLPGVGATVRDELPRLGGSWVSALFLVGLMVPFRNPGLSRLRWFLVVSLTLVIFVQNLGRTFVSEANPDVNSETLIVWFVPLVFLFGIAFFYTLLDQLPFQFPWYRSAAVGAFIVVASIPMIFAFTPPKPWPVAWPPYFPPRIQEVAVMMRNDELMMSDMPWAVAWYGDRPCIWTTLDAGNTPPPNDFFALNDYIKPVKGLLLTPLTTDTKFISEMLKGNESAWSRFILDSMIRTNVPPGFPLRYSPQGYLPEFLFLTDRKRW